MAYDLGTARGTIELDYDGKGAVDKAEHDMNRIDKKSKDTDKSLVKLGSTLGALGKGVKLAAIGAGLGIAAVQAANLAVQLLGIVPQLTSIASLSAALPTAFVAIGASIGVIKAAMAGVGDTLKAAFDPKGAAKFAEGLKQLAPAAQQFATAVRDNSKALTGYQKGIQQAFFSTSGLTQAVPRVVALLKTIRPSILGIATDFGRVTAQVTRFATNSKTIGFVNNSLVAFRQALAVITPTLTPILNGLRAVGAVGTGLIPKLGSAVAKVATTFSTWLNSIASSGQLQEWINTALSTLSTLGGLAKNVGSILLSVFQAAGETSGGLLGNLKTITGQFAAFLSSAEGASAIRALFTGIGAAAKALAPIITTLVGALAGALGPALVQISSVVGPALLAVVQALAPALKPVATALVAVVTAVTPLLGPIAQLVAVLAELAGGILQTLAAEFGPLIALFAGGLSTALQNLSPLIQSALVKGLPLAAQAGQALLQAFQPLLPIILQFGQVLTQSLIDNMPELLGLAQQLIPVFTNLGTALAGSLGTALQNLIPYIPMLVDAFIKFVEVAVLVEAAVLKIDAAIINFATFMSGIPGKILGFLTGIKDAFVNAFNAVTAFLGTAIAGIVAFFTGLPGRIGAALSALPGQIVSWIKSAASQAAFAFGAMIGTLVTQAYQLPGRVANAISGLGSAIAGVAKSAWNAVRSAFSSGINAVVGFASALPGRVRSAISALPGQISSVAKAAWSATRAAFSAGINNAVALARSLPGRIRSAVGNLAGLLAAAGRDAVQGLINGIRSGIGAVADAARSLGASVAAGVKSTLKIGSPSKVMIQLGRYVTQGFEIGLLGGVKSIQSASNKLSNAVLDAFNTDKNTKTKGLQRLISAKTKNSLLSIISTGTKQMLSLANQSTAVSAKLKTAQDNLAAVQKSYNDTYAAAVDQTKKTFSLVTAGQSFVNLDLTKQRFQEAVDQAKKFAANIQNLTKRGLSKDLLQQLVDAGASDGGAMADALAHSTDATLKQFNTMQGQLNTAATQVGKTTADALYGAGLNAAKGLVAGLQKQQAALQKQMDKLADAMVARIKKALKIKSPSRIMFSLGKFTTQGLLDGILSLRRQVEAAASSLANSSIIPTVQLAASNGAAQSDKAFAAASVTGAVFNYNQTVNALPGMSVTQFAKYSVDKLRYGLSSGVIAAALPTPSPAGA